MKSKLPRIVERIQSELEEELVDGLDRSSVFEQGFIAAVNDLQAYSNLGQTNNRIHALRERVVQLRRIILTRSWGEGVPSTIENELDYAEGQFYGYLALLRRVAQYCDYDMDTSAIRGIGDRDIPPWWLFE
ncbi:MAG: hypothetical protein N2111_00880 [Candidatus Sumerlaeaceae bacterium]|nr:hypothetical protein [Candidatus Sumerlaeaceae bacterium]